MESRRGGGLLLGSAPGPSRAGRRLGRLFLTTRGGSTGSRGRRRGLVNGRFGRSAARRGWLRCACGSSRRAGSPGRARGSRTTARGGLRFAIRWGCGGRHSGRCQGLHEAALAAGRLIWMDDSLVRGFIELTRGQLHLVWGCIERPTFNGGSRFLDVRSQGRANRAITNVLSLGYSERFESAGGSRHLALHSPGGSGGSAP